MEGMALRIFLWLVLGAWGAETFSFYSSGGGRSLGGPCRDLRYNRYGAVVCLDPYNAGPMSICPIMPRMLIECTSPHYIKRPMIHQKCNSDLECPKRTKCCVDICPETRHKICAPDDFLGYFIPH